MSTLGPLGTPKRDLLMSDRSEKIQVKRQLPDDGREHSGAHDLHSAEKNALRLYMREISHIPLLSLEEETALARLVRQGSEEARTRMIKSNLRLVVKIANGYANFALPLLDLISEGNIGLIKAVERFDPDKGGKLSTYAAWWIKQSIKRALANQSKTIRLPVHLVDKLAKLRKVALALTEELGREPTVDEIAAEIGLPVNKVAHLKSVSLRPTSLDAPIGDDEGTEFGDLVGDENATNPFEYLRSKSLMRDINSMISQLEAREAQILRMRFGLGDESPTTLEQVGRRFNITRERVRQIQNMALAKMRRQMARKEHQRSIEEIRQEEVQAQRMKVLREFYAETIGAKENRESSDPTKQQ